MGFRTGFKGEDVVRAKHLLFCFAVAAAGAATGAVSNGAEVVPVGDRITQVNTNFSIRAPRGWFRTITEASNTVSFVKGLRKTYLYTGGDAPAPSGANVKCRVLLMPSEDYKTEEACEKALRSLHLLLDREGYRRGELAVYGLKRACYLAPETGRTIFIVTMTFGKQGISAVVVLDRPDAKFPGVVVDLLDGITCVAEKR